MSLTTRPTEHPIRTSCSDAELVARLQQRDPRALAELYDRYAGAVLALMLRAGNDAAAAEDRVQEVYSRLWRDARAIDARLASLAPWLLTVAHRIALNRSGEACTEDARRAREAAHSPESTSTARPPAALRRRILAAAGFEQRPFGWASFWAGAAVLLLAAALYFSGRERQFAEDVGRARDLLRAQSVALARYGEGMALLRDPETATASFGAAGTPRGKLLVDSAGVLLVAGNLPALPAGKALQMWIAPAGARRLPLGVFRPGADGTAMHLAHHRCAPGDVVTVTVENQDGAERPTSAPIVSVAVPAASQ